MKYIVLPTNRFKKDLKLCQKRNINLTVIKNTILKLQNGEFLPEKYHEHLLKGEYAYCLECHVQPDLLMIYQYDIDNGILYLYRVGTHSDLFK